MSKDKAYGFIYITTNLINNKKYIGKKKYEKYKNFDNYLGSGKILNKEIEEYGKENFDRKIIAFGYDATELNVLEKHYISLYDAVNSDDYYNMTFGGDGGNTFICKSEEEMTEIGNKISKFSSGRNHTEESKKKISNSNSGKKKSEEHKLKLSQSRIGKYSGQESPMWGKHHSEITKEKMKNAKIGTKLSEETKNKMSELRKGEKHPNYGKFGANSSYSVSVILINTGEVFHSIIDASNKYNIHASNISMCCRGKVKSAGKHPETGEKLVWMYNN